MCAADGSADYFVKVSPAATRDLRQLAKSLPRNRFARLDGKMRALAQDPRPVGSEKLSAKEDIYRIRDGDFRIIYEVRDTDREVEIARVRDRKDVYRP